MKRRLAFAALLTATATGCIHPDGGMAKSKHAKLFPVYLLGQVRVSLKDPKPHFLTVALCVAVDEADRPAAYEALGQKRAHVRSWLIVYFSDLAPGQARGAAGLRNIRREVRDGLNDLLWPGGKKLIREVLFEEFRLEPGGSPKPADSGFPAR